MKKLVILLLAAVIALAVVSCEPKTDESKDTTAGETTVENAGDTTAEETTAAAE